MRFRTGLGLLAVAFLFPPAGSGPAFAARDGGGSPGRLTLPATGFPPLSDAEKAMTKAPFDEGAGSVVLLEAQSINMGGSRATILEYFHRIKVLNQAAVKTESDYVLHLDDETRVGKIEARTILPAGGIVDASANVHDEKTSDGGHEIRISFPQVEPGAILDLHISSWSESIYQHIWRAQGRSPVVLSQLTITVPPWLAFRTAGSRLGQEDISPAIRNPAGGKKYTWTFRDLPGLPEEPNQPYLEDISKTFYFIPTEISDPVYVMRANADWKTLIKSRSESWENWSRQKSFDTAAITRAAVEGKTTMREKADAIRRVLRERVKLEWRSDDPMRDSPDATFSTGSGTSADIAGTAMTMLREAGIKSCVVAVRRRPGWPIYEGFPIPGLLNDMIVAIPGESAVTWFDPSSDIATGKLPWELAGASAVQYDGKSTAPLLLPDFTSADNKSARSVTATVDASGNLSAESLFIFNGVAAEQWRRALRPLPADKRVEQMRDVLRRYVPGAVVESFEAENLDSDGPSLSLKTKWSAESYASVAGKRLIVNPNLIARLDAGDWSAPTRRTDIDLEFPRELIDSVLMNFPEGSVLASTPAQSSHELPGAGTYSLLVQRLGEAVSVRRKFRLDQYRFVPENWGSLKSWFTDNATSDDQPIVVTLP
jgi:hypothetical protein